MAPAPPRFKPANSKMAMSTIGALLFGVGMAFPGMWWGPVLAGIGGVLGGGAHIRRPGDKCP